MSFFSPAAEDVRPLCEFLSAVLRVGAEYSCGATWALISPENGRGRFDFFVGLVRNNVGVGTSSSLSTPGARRHAFTHDQQVAAIEVANVFLSLVRAASPSTFFCLPRNGKKKTPTSFPPSFPHLACFQVVRDCRHDVCCLGESGVVGAALEVYGRCRGGSESGQQITVVRFLRMLIAAHNPEGARSEEEGTVSGSSALAGKKVAQFEYFDITEQFYCSRVQ